MILRAHSLRSRSSAPCWLRCLAAGTAFAQQPQSTVAKLTDVQGNVLVSRGDAMVAGGNERTACRSAPGS